MTTPGQQAVLEALTDGPHVVAELFDMGTKNAVRKRLRRLEDNGLVRRIYLTDEGVAAWELTAIGRRTLTQS